MYNISQDIEKIKDDLTNMYIAFNHIGTADAQMDRESENILDVKKQFKEDKIFANALRNNALEIFDICNKILMINSI